LTRTGGESECIVVLTWESDEEKSVLAGGAGLEQSWRRAADRGLSPQL